MPKTKKLPLRMCLSCRNLLDKRDMLRIVKTGDGSVNIDRTGKAAGRGAYICDNPDCVKKLRKQKLLNKAFSCAVDDSVYATIEEEYFGAR